MSTILKALKRIDQTAPSPEDLQSRPGRIDTREVVRGRLYKRWLSRRVAAALALALVFIAAGWLLYSQRHLLTSKSGAQKAPVYQAKISPPPGRPEAPAAQTDPSARDRSGAAGQSGALSRRPPEQQNQAKRMRTSMPESRAARPASKARTGISGMPAIDAERSDQSSTPPTLAPTQKSQSRRSRDTRSYRRLDDPKIKLQAIAWSSNAAQRIAVVNNRIVREGESVEGYSVNQIRQEDVIVNDGTQSWQLEFGLK